MATQRPLMDNGRLFHSPIGLFGFQAEAVAHAFYDVTPLGILDVGLGKTVIGMALAGELYEADEIDLVIHVGRRNKISRSEFPADWAEFTSLSTLVYHGTGREKRLAKRGIPDVLLTTYETGKLELMARVKTPGRRGKGARADGPLVQTLGLRDKRILWLFDEVTKFGNRGSELYLAYEYILNQLRRGPHRQYVYGLTATPMRTDYEQPFNIGRIVAPHAMPSVGDFERDFTRGRDDYGHYIYRKQAREWFALDFQKLIYRKRHSDPDVVSQMPKLTEKLWVVPLEPNHRALYDAVGELYGENPDELPLEQQDQLKTALRLTAGHPRAHLHSASVMSRAVVETLGEDYLRSIPSSKSLRLIEELELLVRGQDAQVLVFTFYANTVLPELHEDLFRAGFSVATYTGGNTDKANEEAKAAFKRGDVQVLLSSEAGSEGLNLPEAHYIIEYESARTFDQRTQRFGRATRITSENAFVHGVTMVAEKTLEVATVQTVLARNKWQDRLLGDVGAIGHTDSSARRRNLGPMGGRK